MQGSARVNDTVELPQLRLQRKIRSMQMFKKPQQRCTRVRFSLSSTCIPLCQALLVPVRLRAQPLLCTLSRGFAFSQLRIQNRRLQNGLSFSSRGLSSVTSSHWLAGRPGGYLCDTAGAQQRGAGLAVRPRKRADLHRSDRRA